MDIDLMAERKTRQPCKTTCVVGAVVEAVNEVRPVLEPDEHALPSIEGGVWAFHTV
jgi:hypothetical protein